MKVNYLGPFLLADNQALAELYAKRSPPSCFLLEVSEEALPDGEVIEGDVLVVDEARSPGHDDRVVAEVEETYQLFRTHRIEERLRLLPVGGGQGRFIGPEQFIGVVVQKVRVAA
ncbi:S24 family peptidase [Halomonas vilamensis]|uniref:S24 family peptidase n=1 Tax=Vreelandella vilamensis TaxID=531309 RepID=A0ABU1H0Z4_9GAMM|nr:S24 family peptidase [Halomonas vilamensis]MDR5897933.1 S24 family peptidase [Halomonas vilamensis]